MNDIQWRYKPNWVENSFIRFFRKTVSQHLDPREVHLDFVQIYHEEVKHIGDRQSQTHYVMCAYVLAAYIALLEKKESQEAIKDLEEVMVRFGAGFTKWSMRIFLWLGLYNRKYVETKVAKTTEERYGGAFSISEERGRESYVIKVHKCAYNDFFKRRGYPELTKVFCAWDTIWSKEINRQKRGLSFKRPTTLAEDEQPCRFEFHFEDS